MPIRFVSRRVVCTLLLASFTLVLAAGCGSEKSESATAPTIQTNVDGKGSDQPKDQADQAISDTETKPDALYSPEAFRLAAHDGKLRVVQICIESGLDVNEADPSGLTPLAMAAYNGHDDVVKLLIKNKAIIDSRDHTGKTPLIHAASGPAPTTVALLLDAGADIDAVDDGEHWTALMMAAAEGQAEVVEVLLARGAKKEMIDIDGESAADFAKSNGHMKIAEKLDTE